MKYLERLGCLALVLVTVTFGAGSPAQAEHRPAATIADVDVIQPATLAAQLADATQPRPLLLQVGAHVLYQQAHIAGAEYVGSGSTDDGLSALRKRLSGVAKDAPIVLYCGCCPWSRCPNIAPAYDELHRLGYRGVKALYIANDFGTDWVDRGYPVAQGE